MHRSTAKHFPITAVRQLLKAHKVDKDFFNRILPAYWEDEFSAERTGMMRACAALSRALGLELEPLLEEKPQVVFKPQPRPQYKKAANKDESEVAMATSVGISVAAIASKCVQTEFAPIPSANVLRDLILASGKPWVDLDSLLEVCWSRGIPVIYVKNIAGKKMDAMAVMIDGRPCVLLAKKVSPHSKLAFWIAHELGHIACGHLDDFVAMPDPTVDRATADPKEVEANQYALTLLFGEDDPAYTTDGATVYPEPLADVAKEVGSASRVDPAAIINNWCFHEVSDRKRRGLGEATCNKAFGTATSALKLVGDPQDALDLVQRYAEQHLSKPPTRDAAELFQKLTELNLAD